MAYHAEVLYCIFKTSNVKLYDKSIGCSKLISRTSSKVLNKNGRPAVTRDKLPGGKYTVALHIMFLI